MLQEDLFFEVKPPRLERRQRRRRKSGRRGQIFFEPEVKLVKADRIRVRPGSGYSEAGDRRWLQHTTTTRPRLKPLRNRDYTTNTHISSKHLMLFK